MAKKKSARRQMATKTGAARSGRFFEVEFNPDYSYVLKDLKRIGILAGSFFVVLVVLSFFLG